MESLQWPTRTRLPPLPEHVTRPHTGFAQCRAVELRRLLLQGSPPGGVSALVTELLHFVGSLRGCSRGWWLELREVLRLLRPFRQSLAPHRGRLLPALERLHRQYEQQRHLLGDLDIRGALRDALPADTSALFRLPRDVRSRCRAHEAPVRVPELAGCVGGVGAELAAAESPWECGPKELTRALRTELPLTVQPGTEPAPSEASSVLHPEPEKGPGATIPLVTGYEAAEMLVRDRHRGKVVFLYLNRTGRDQNCSYDLQVADLSQLHPEHWVFSPFGILHVSPGSGSEVQELGVWHREAVLCRTLRRIPFYRDFRKTKTFTWWQRSTRRIRFLRRRNQLGRRLLMSVPHYTAALHHISRFLQELAQLPWFPPHISNPIPVDKLQSDQRQIHSKAKKHLNGLHSLTLRVLEMVRQDTYIMVQTSQEDAVHCQEGTNMERLQHIQTWLHRLGSLSCLVEHMICENLMSILQQNICTFVSDIIQMMPTTGRSFLLIHLEFGEDGALRICPSACQIQHSIEQMVEDVLDSVLEVLDTSGREQSVAPSGTHPPAEHGSPVHPVLGGLLLRQVVPAPTLQPDKCKKNPGGLRVEGHQQTAHYLPLNFQFLPHMLHSDCTIQEARRKLQRLLQDSLAEVEAFCADHAWLSDIHLYVQSWSPHILGQLRGSSARDYEDLILKLQQWEQRVSGLRDCVTTAVLEVRCEVLHTRTAPGLGSILQDVLVLLTSVVADESRSLIHELSQALQILRGVSTEISAFSKCAHKVTEYKMRKPELEERVDHVRCLHEVIRMNYRQQTAEERNINTKLTEVWDTFLHSLKTSAEFLSSHLPSVAGSLERSFQACYTAAADLIAASSAAHYQDPSHNVAQVLRELRALHHKLCSALSQLRDFSHSRQILHGKSFDLSVINDAEQQLQARQDSWKLLSRCREQIATWELRPFPKVNIEQVREKLQQWQMKLQELTLTLPAGDPILQSVGDHLEDFTQHLPLLQSLLDPAVKHKHWVAIFAVLGKTFEGLETLTLKELLSCRLLKEQKEIHKILLRARAEFSILQDFGKIRTFWQEREFRLVRFFLCVSREDPWPEQSRRPPSGKLRDCAKGYGTRDTGTFLLADAPALCRLLEDSLLSLQTIGSSPYSAAQQTQISGWIQKLRNLGQVLHLWVTFQGKWVFLTRVQNELGTCLPWTEMVTDFQSIDHSYRSFLAVTLLDPLVLSIVTPGRRRAWHFYGDSLCSTLQRGISVMEAIIAALGDVLFTSRCDFPRLFFLGDHDVVEVLAASPEPSDRLPCALQCFPHFTDVLFQVQAPESSGFPLIGIHVTVGVTGKYGEGLDFSPPIAWHPRTVSWLIDLEQRVRESLKNALSMCLSEGRLNRLQHKGLRWWLDRGLSYPLQCLVVTEEVLYCEDLEKLILTDQRSRLTDGHNLKIEMLVEKLRHTASIRQEQAFLSAWVGLAVLQRDRTSDLLGSGMQTLGSFSWAKQMKYRAAIVDKSMEDGVHETLGDELPSSPLCVVDVLGQLLPYGYEYVGLDMNIMEAAVSERTSLGLILALQQYQCAALTGHDEGLSSQTLMALGSALGRQVVVLKCWSGLTVSRLTLHLQGALQAGAWLVLDSAQKLRSHVLASLGRLLGDIQASCEALVREGSTDTAGAIHIQFEERTLLVNRNYGCILTLPAVDVSLGIPYHIRRLLRPVSFCPPDLHNAAQLAFLSAGFQEPFLLAKKLSFFLRVAAESGAVPAASVFPLLKNVVEKAIAIFKSGQEAMRLAEDPVQQPSLAHEWPAVATSAEGEVDMVATGVEGEADMFATGVQGKADVVTTSAEGEVGMVATGVAGKVGMVATGVEGEAGMVATGVQGKADVVTTSAEGDVGMVTTGVQGEAGRETSGVQEKAGVVTTGAEGDVGMVTTGVQKEVGVVTTNVQEEVSMVSNGVQEEAGMVTTGVQEEAGMVTTGVQEEASMVTTGVQEEAGMVTTGVQEEAGVVSTGVQEEAGVVSTGVQEEAGMLTTGVQEEAGVVTALLSSSIWSSCPVSEDSHLMDVLWQVFPTSGPPAPIRQAAPELIHALQIHLHESGLEGHPELTDNVMGLFQALQHSSGVVLTGPSGSGKTTCWKALQQVLNRLVSSQVGADGEASLSVPSGPPYRSVHSVHLFPNSLSLSDLLGGGFDCSGVFSSVLHGGAQKWVIMDGSVALTWVEPVSYLLGLQPVLTLDSGQQLRLTDQIKLLFEMLDTSALSPAMSTRCSFIYCGGQETWRTIVKAALSNMFIRYRITQSTQDELQGLSNQLIPTTLCFLEEHCSTALHPTPHTARGVHQVSSFCTILQALMDQHLLRDSSHRSPEQAGHRVGAPQATTQGSEGGALTPAQASMLPPTGQSIPADNHLRAQVCFLYAFIWAFGGHLHPRHHSEFDGFLRKILVHCSLHVAIPQDTSVFEVSPSPDGLTLTAIPGAGRQQTEGLLFAARCLALSGHPVLLVGSPCGGKTTLAQSMVHPEAATIRIPISSVLRATHLRQLLKTHHEAPPAIEVTRVRTSRGRQIFILDDLHEAWTDPESGTRPALEVVRQMVSDHRPQDSIMATTSPPEYGYGALCPRLSRLFCVLLMAPPAPDVLLGLFSPRFMVWLKKSVPVQQPKELGEALASASISLYHQVTKAFPSKYCFSLHHLHRLVHSMSVLCPSPGAHQPPVPGANLSAVDLTRRSIVRLWLHEALRTFGDGLETPEEMEMFRGLLQGCALRTFSDHDVSKNVATDVTGTVELPSGDGKLLGDLQPIQTTMETKMSTKDVRTEAGTVSQDQGSAPRKVLLAPELLVGDDDLRDLSFRHEYSQGMPVRSDSYRERPSQESNLVQTDLTLSADDCHHLALLTRVLHLPRGHIVLLSQHPGSGRRRLSRLAAQLSQCALLELSGQETSEERHSVIREACGRAGVQGSAAAILAPEGIPEKALQELEALIREGTFPGLYSAEQEETALQSLGEKSGNRNASKKALRERYNIQVRNNLHVIILQRGGAQTPQLQRLAYKDVYSPWGPASLQQVAAKLLGRSRMFGSPAAGVSRAMSVIHLLAQSYCRRMWPQLPLTSPGVFISFIHIYLEVSSELQATIELEGERLRRAVTRVQQVSAVRQQCTADMEDRTRRLTEAEQERKHWSDDLEKIQEEERRLMAESTELGRAKAGVTAELSGLQGQRQHQLEQACLQWASVQKDLTVSDVEEIRSYRAPPPPVIMVTNVLCTLFGKESGWENARLLLGQENFYQDLQFYNGRSVSDQVFSSLTRAVQRPEFDIALVRSVSAAAASLCHWLLGLQRFCSFLRTLETGRALLAALEAKDSEMAEKMAALRLQQEELKVRRARSAQNLHKAQEMAQDLQRELHELRSKQSAVHECESRARPHLGTWSAALETLRCRLQSLHTDALLLSASITYLGCLPWRRSTALLAKWWSACHDREVSVDPDDVREALDPPDANVPDRLLTLLRPHSERKLWQRARLPVSTETLTRVALLRARGRHSALLRPTLILDPDLRAERWLQVLLCVGVQESGKVSPSPHNEDGPSPVEQVRELCVIDASDVELPQRLASAVGQGLSVLLRDVEQTPSCLEIVRSLLCRRGKTLRPGSSLKQEDPPSGSAEGSLQTALGPPEGEALAPLFLSTSLPLHIFVREVGAAFLKDVTVVDLSLGPSALEEELLQEVVLLKDPRLQEERWSLGWNALTMTEELHSAQDALLDYVSSGLGSLVDDEGFLGTETSAEEAQAGLQASLLDVEALQQRIEDHVAPYVSAARGCAQLFSRLQELSRLSPHYHFPASSVLGWALGALHHQVESGQELEKILIGGLLTRVLPMVAEEHRRVLRLLLAVGQPHPLEWLSFLGLTHRSETSSSCIQRPPWVEADAWEELGQLEKISAFQGIRSSLSSQTKQWQEYFRLRSTVIGPVPCSSFSHLTLFQAAILWRILKPKCLGLVLSHLTSCILGPEPEDLGEGDVISRSGPRTPLLFLLPPYSPDLPRNYIQHMARKSGKEVKILSWTETCPSSYMRDTLLTSQREGQWLLLSWHPGVADALVTGEEDEVDAGFRLCVTVEEEKTLRSMPVAFRHGCRSAPCALRLTLRDVLLQSCLDVAEDLGEPNPLTLKLLILHSVLLLRQEYSSHVQHRIYCWGHQDLKNALCAVRTLKIRGQDRSEALTFIIGAVIYGGHVVEDGDAQRVMAVVQLILSPQRGGRGLPCVMSALGAAGNFGPWTHRVRRSLQKLLCIRDPAALGLSEGLKNLTTTTSGHRVFSELLLTQDIWTFAPSRAGDPGVRSQRTSSETTSRHSVAHDAVSRCLALLLELQGELQRTEDKMSTGQPGTGLHHRTMGTTAQEQPDTWAGAAQEQPDTWAGAAQEQPDTWAGAAQEQPVSKPRPLLRFLHSEWRLLRSLIRAATEEIRDAAASCRCQRCQEIRKVLSEGQVPPWWNVYPPASPITLQAWIQGLHQRLWLLSTYVSQPLPSAASYNMSVFQRPSRLLHSLLQERALDEHRGMESYRLRVQVCGRRSARSAGVSLVGVHLRCALWDTRLEMLQETLSPQLCALPALHVCAEPDTSGTESSDPAQPHYLCPLYPGGDPEGHKQHDGGQLLLIPLPTSVTPCVWSQRRVHALSLL